MLKVNLLSNTPNPEEVVASAAKLCYSQVGVDEIMERQNEESIENFIRRLASIKHLSPFEHATFTFAVEGVSRTLTHQLVRHRLASYSQQSQRYVKEDAFEYIIPPAIEKNEIAKGIYLKQMEDSQKAYDSLVRLLIFDYIKARGNSIKDSEYSSIEKQAIEDARYIFPNATETKIVVTMNARSLMHFFKLRCCNRAQWEIRGLADKMLSEVVKVAPAIFMNTGAPCTFGKCPEGAMSCGKVRTMEDILKA